MAKEKSKNIPLWLYNELELFAQGDFDIELLREHVTKVIEQKKFNDGNHIIQSEIHNPNRSAEDRETLRQIYLDRKGIPDSFRW